MNFSLFNGSFTHNHYILGGNKLCLDVWKGEENGGPYLHSVHFAFAIGCFVAPVLAEPFLGRNPALDDDTNDTFMQN